MLFSGTGFSREEGRAFTLNFAARHLTLSRLKPVPQFAAHAILLKARMLGRTGFSREGASAFTLYLAARHPTLSRLKPVPQIRGACDTSEGTHAW